MASPDIQEYVDLTLYDVDAQDIYLEALDALRSTLPEFTPREGMIELVLLQALGQEVAETVFSINRLPSAITEALLRLYGISRSTGTAATTTLTFTSSAPDLIPAGTRLLLVDSGNSNALMFTTDVATTLTSIGGGLYANSAPVACTASSVGSYFNNQPAGTTMLLVDTIPNVLTVLTASTIVDGSDAEADSAYFTRATSTLGRLTQALVLPSQFDSYVAANFTYASRVKTLDGVVQTGNNRAGGSAGYVAIVACGPGGAYLSGSQKTAIDDDVQEICQANLVVNVYDPCIVRANITANVKAFAGAAQPVAEVTAAVGEYVSPDSWDWSTTLRKNELISLIDRVSNVEYVDSLTLAVSSAEMGTGVSKTSSFSVDGSGNIVLSGTDVVGGVLYTVNTFTLNWV